MTASCSILLAVGQAIFQASLTRKLLRVVSQEETYMLIAAGAADVNGAIRTANLNRSGVIDAYNSALTDVFVSPISLQGEWRAKSDTLNSTFPLWGPQSHSCSSRA